MFSLYHYFLRKWGEVRGGGGGAYFRGGRLIAILAERVGAYSGEGAYYSVGSCSRKCGIPLQSNQPFC